MRQNRERRLCIVIANSHVRPLARHSVRTERWEGDFVLMELLYCGVVIVQEPVPIEIHRSLARKSQPLMVEPIVDLDDPELFRSVTPSQSSH